MNQETAVAPLLQNGRINRTELKNRIVMGPMAAAAPGDDGAPSRQTIAFFRARAKGGVSMIIMGGSIATTRGYAEAMLRPLLRLDIDETIPGFRKLTDAVHEHGTPIIAQLTPGFGRMGVPAPDRPLISASPINVVIPEANFPAGFIVPHGRVTETPQEATIAQIKHYEDEMVLAAVRARKAGFDGVEVAAHMSYFAASFSSPRTNFRTDEYGGSVENRARFLRNIVTATRAAVGPDFIIGLRITANEYLPDGQGPDGYAAIAANVEAAGLDYVALSAGAYETMSASAPSTDGALVDGGEAAAFRKVLKGPILIQGFHAPERAAKVVKDGLADFVMLARPLLADPDFANKLKDNKTDSITVCDRHNTCMRRMVFGMPVRCTVNPRMGREERDEGASRPASRLLKAPIEEAVLSLTGSTTLMGVIRSVTPNKQ
ncbi:NADH:flavin oxidoreductase [Novosphingobium sp. MMS21-SN21R]|uniref:NADH:flavin oxidoreductase n=1 Tax=Novosphingobium sp. MMS21-SN21R TaxID=2969298 RepID=UPI00288515C4|nr:NADH:flavin oxidoreductase [Novosphingobium sp. MMS21-SN21R]MDT0510245.1 NADH:flavin oxidoreductase [Novosphingobium sp. MMS21-SN21R]